MKNAVVLSLVGAGLLGLSAPPMPVAAQAQPPKVALPQPGVPQVMTIEGNFVRAAYNNEGYVILGYEPVQRSLDEEWVLLEIGVTVRDNVPDFTMKRDALSLDTPDGRTVPMATTVEFRAGNTAALQNRAKVQRDSINYFPPKASRACRIGFFTELDQRAMAYDEVEISDDRACLGRVYFHLPEKIKYGQYWLNVKFPQSVLRVPFRIFTKEEEQLVNKNYKSIRQQVEDAFKPKKK
jgi:hypothetical protein